MRRFAGTLRAVFSTTALSAMVGVVPASAWAQQVPGSTAPAPDGIASEKPIEEITVTGSRIVRQDYVANSPLLTVPEAVIKNSGSISIGDALSLMPQFAASTGATNQGNDGRSQVNLRGLGAMRALVLQDGRRIQPSDGFGTVDLNTLSPALIESVEIITGGASAVYGSDAISGVVNFKLKRNFEGAAIDAQYGITELGDGQSHDVNLLLGGNFAGGRGNAILAIGHSQRNEILRGRNKRKFFGEGALNTLNRQHGFITQDASNFYNVALYNSIFAGYGFVGTPGRSYLSTNPDGTLFHGNPAQNYRWPAYDPQNFSIINNAVNEFTDQRSTLQQPLDRYTAFSRVTYDLTEDITSYTQLNFTSYDTRTVTDSGGVVIAAITAPFIPVTNPFLPEDLRRLAATRPQPNAPFRFNITSGAFFDWKVDNSYDVLQVLQGFRGNLPVRDWSYDVNASYGRTRNITNIDGVVSDTALTALINAADGGRSLCSGGLNLFPLMRTGPTAISEDCLDFLRMAIKRTTVTEQQIAEATVQGGLYELPAGEIRFAAGINYRRNTFDFRPDAAEKLNPATGRIEADGSAPTEATAGATNVKEVYGELSMPVLRDLPLVRSLEVDVAGRYSKYNLAGSVATYKADSNWQVNSWLGFRGGYERAIRAPSVFELFQGPNTGISSVGEPTQGGGDPCDTRSAIRRNTPNPAAYRALCIAQGLDPSLYDTFVSSPNVTVRNRGNPSLKPEKANTYTIGGVLRPDFSAPILRRTVLSLDYYYIGIKDAIGAATGSVVVSRCFNADGVSNPSLSLNNFYCSLMTRRDGSVMDVVAQPTLNLSRFQTAGLDAQIDWGFDLGAVGLEDSDGSIDLNTVVSYTTRYAIQTTNSTPLLDYKGTIGNNQIDIASLSHPKWGLTSTLTYTLDPIQFSVRYRYIGPMANANNITNRGGTQLGVPAISYFDLNGRWNISESIQLHAGVINLLDRYPAQYGLGFGSTDRGTYDVVGRRFFIRASAKF